MKSKMCFLLTLIILTLCASSVNAGQLEGSRVKLSDLEPYTVDEIKCVDGLEAYYYVEDNFHGQHTDGAILYAAGGFCYPGTIEYLLDGEYAELTGTLYVPYESRECTDPTTFRIYGDDKLLYEGPSLNERDKPVDFAVNVEGVTFMKIVAVGGWYKGDGSGAKPVMCAGNLYLDKEKTTGVAKNNNLPTMYLSEMQTYVAHDLYHGSYSIYDYVHDDFGKVYTSVNYNDYYGVIANDDVEGSNAEYYLAGAYKRLTGVVYVPACSSRVNDNNKVGSPCVNIYVDGKLTNQYVLTGRDVPVEFVINVENADFVKIELFGGWYEGNGNGMVPLMCVADLAVYN